MKTTSYHRFFSATLASTSALAILFAAPMPSLANAYKTSPRNLASTQNKTETIILAVDGFSYFAFREAQSQGLFKEFSNFGAHVSPFPSMTDLSWAVVTQTSDLFGSAGRIKSVEATYFDESSQSIQGDPRDYYRRLAFPKYYMGAFDTFFNPYVEALMYFPTEEVPKLEIKTVVDDLLSAKPKKFLTGYIGAVDSIAHTQLNRLHPTLRLVDAEIKRLTKSFKDKGQDVEIILISDHGNIGRFQEGKPEQELIGVDVHKIVSRAGLKSVQQLQSKKDVAIPLMALGSWAPIYLKDRSQMNSLIQEFRKETWFDMAVYINRNNSSETLMTAITDQGEARIKYDKIKDLYYYLPVQGNPLRIAKDFHSAENAYKALTSIEAMKASEGTLYPDALYRIIESASERNFDFPDMILTLKDGYFIQNSLGAFTKMYRTHGSLSASSSYGLIASNKRKVPGQIRSKDILSFIGVEAKTLFADISEKHKSTGKKSLDKVLADYKKGIQTDAKDLSQPRIFRHLTKFVSDTRPYFLVSEMSSFMEAFKFDPFQDPAGRGLSPLNFDISKFDIMTMISPEDIGAVTDAVLTSGSAENLMNDPRIQQVKERVGFLKDQKTMNLDLQNMSVAQNDDGILGSIKKFLLPAKRAAMKLYQLPFLLENSIVIQEKPFLPETRDVHFARSWVANKDKYTKSFKNLTHTLNPDHLSAAQNLLKEASKEADLEGRIYPTPMTKIYNQKLENLTIVYVPGIYNSIFDKEIFSLGLNALSDEMGLRVIQPPVESTCASEVNADIILDFLMQDYRTRTQRGHAAPRYLFISYSKGAIDTLHALVKSPNFMSGHVKGVVAVAAPLHGSSILNTTDVPFALVSALSENQGPSVCAEEKTASKSITPTAMDSFWRKNERTLTGLTRYFSVTFQSDPEDSHIFMKATKLIGQFDEDNDGVVTVSSSKFPKNLMAVDLGTVKGDHLAGILSSRFNQKAFMKGLVNTLSEVNINDDKNNFIWNSEVILSNANSTTAKDRRFFRMKQPGLVERLSLGEGKFSESLLYATTYELSRQVLPKLNDPADSYEVKTKLPSSGLKYDPYHVLDVSKLADIMGGVRVSPTTRQNMPEGININYDHTNMVHFRMDHQFNYESRSPGGLDDNKNFGYITTEVDGEKWAQMKSVNNSIRMTTLAYRFAPTDFSKMSLRLAVLKDVVGADPVKGKTGKDDSAFQLWFTIRDGKANGDRSVVDPKNDKVFLFGYYWGGAVPGEDRKAGDIFVNWYSDKNIVIATLPTAKQLLLNNQDMLGKAQNYERNLAEDLRQAFPDRNVNELEIVAITMQHDSNDTASSSEALFKSLQLAP